MFRHATVNRAYTLAWNEEQQAFVPAPEKTRRRGKRSASVVAAAVAALLGASGAQAVDVNALPTGGKVTAGQATIGQAGNTTTIQQGSNKAAIDWQSFNIGRDASVKFVQPGANSVVLNRVVTQDPTQILGTLTANGQVFIVNPNGVLFGKGAQVSAAGVLASTRNLSNDDFMAGRLTLSGSGTGSVVNQGSINAASGGYVVLVGAQVVNDGTITAPQGDVRMAAANQVTLAIDNAGLVAFTVEQGTLDALAANNGLIKADGGRIFLTADALDQLSKAVVNNQGVIEAQTVDNRNGKIVLMGDMRTGTTIAGGTLDASAPHGGDGGFIETSAAHVKVVDGHTVTTKASQGRSGTWLIDPTDYTVAATGGDTTGAQLSTDLGNGNVTIDSANGGAGTDGNVNVNDTVAWSANQLKLTAQNNINVNANMTGTGTASLALVYGQGARATGNTSVYTLADNVRIDLPTGNTLSTQQGSDGVVKSFYVLNSLGTESSNTTTDLQGIQGDLSGNYALGSNIDASATADWTGNLGFLPMPSGFTSLGTSGNAFGGNFEGLGHTIDQLTVATPNSYAGLFGEVAAGSRVSNVTLSNVNVQGGVLNVGGVVGHNLGTIDHVSVTEAGHVAGTLVDVNGGDGQNVGGIVGLNDGVVQRSHSSIAVEGGSAIGGLIGRNASAGVVTGSDSSGSVTATEEVGGLIGISDAAVSGLHSSATVVTTGGRAGGLIGTASGAVSDSSATGSVSGDDSVGGLIGYADQTVSNSHATGAVTNTGNKTGGLIGSSNGDVTDSDAQGAVSGNANVGGLVGYAFQGAITGSHAIGDVTGTGMAVGGLIGVTFATTISNSFAQGNVQGGNDAVGGLIGQWNQGDPSLVGQLSASSASGTVNGGGNVGGLVGNMSACYCVISDSQASGNVTGLGDYTGGLVGNGGGVTITGSHATGNVIGITHVGGLAGYALTVGASDATGTVSGAQTVGGLVGKTKMGGSISGSHATGNVTASSTQVGGLVGENNAGITDSYASGQVLGTGADRVGGLVGDNVSGDIAGSQAHGSVTGRDYTGGLVGYNEVGNTVSGSTADGAVSGRFYVGGLVGYNDATASVVDSHALGSVSGDADGQITGGLVGKNDGNISTSDASGNVNGITIVGGLVGDNAGSISGSSASGTVTALSYSTGGLAGRSDGDITASSSSGAVTGVDETGGLVGTNTGSISLGSHSSSIVHGHDYVGGLVGENGGSIDDAHATGDVFGVDVAIGGLLGAHSSKGGTEISHSSASGNVSASGTQDSMGGLIGKLENGTLSNALASGSVTGLTNVGGLVGVVGSSAVITDSHATGNVAGASAVGGLVGSNAATLSGNAVDGNTAIGTVTASVGQAGGFAGINTGTIIDVTATNAVSSSGLGEDVGGIVGYNDGLLQNSRALNTVASTGINTGGAVGTNDSDGFVLTTYAANSVTGQDNTGGLVGHNIGSINTAYASGAVVGNNSVGGLVGSNNGSIVSAYATGSATGHDKVGGLIGRFSGSVQYTYASGAVTADTANVGGLAGSQGEGSAANSFYNLETTGQARSVGNGSEVALAKTTAEMQSASTFTGWRLNGSANPNARNANASWRSYEGLTSPLLSYWLTPITITGDGSQMTSVYNGTTQNVAPTLAYTETLEPGHLLGSAGYSGKNVGVYAGLNQYSDQQGYDITYVNLGSLKITPAPLTASLVGVTKTYDGTQSATLGADNYVFSGFADGEGASVMPRNGMYNSKNVADANSVSTSINTDDFSALSGTLLGNYILPTTATGAATITPKSVNVVVTAASKVYDGTTAAQGSIAASGFLEEDSVDVSGTVQFIDKNAGLGKRVTVRELALTGSDAGNYAVNAESAGTTADITPKSITVDATGVAKTYDGSLADAALIASSGLVKGDSVSFQGTGAFADKNVGKGKAVTVNGIAATGADAGNYSYNDTAATTADITPRDITVALKGSVTKLSDGTTTATLNGDNFAVSGLVEGESIGVTQTVGAFDSAAAGDGKQVSTSLSLADYLAASNTSLGNYQLVLGSLSGAIGSIGSVDNPGSPGTPGSGGGTGSSPIAPSTLNSALASLPNTPSGASQGNGLAPSASTVATITASADGTATDDSAATTANADPLSPARASAVSANTKENLLLRRTFSIGDGGIRLPQGVLGSDKDAPQ